MLGQKSSVPSQTTQDLNIEDRNLTPEEQLKALREEIQDYKDKSENRVTKEEKISSNK
jgi:hypothetical protein